MGRSHSSRQSGNSRGNPRRKGAGGSGDQSDAAGRNGGRGFRLPGSGLWASDAFPSLVICGLLLLAVGLVFGQTAGFNFVNYDDNEGVYDNPLVTGELTSQNLLAVFTGRHLESWAPLTCLSHMLVWHLFGHTAAVHHVDQRPITRRFGGPAALGSLAHDRPPVAERARGRRLRSASTSRGISSLGH